MNKHRLFLGLVLAIVTWLAWLFPTAVAAQEPTVRLEPATLQAEAGSAVDVTIRIQDVTNLGAFQFDLTYDPTIVEVENVTLGDFPTSTGRSVNPLGPRIEAGKAVYGAFSFGEAVGPDGSGTLAVVTLQALAGGQTPLGLQNVQVIDVSGSRIPAATEGGSVTVAGSPPAPGQATAATTVGPTTTATATARSVLDIMQSGQDQQASASSTPWQEWLITGGILLALIGIVALAARLMAQSNRSS